MMRGEAEAADHLFTYTVGEDLGQARILAAPPRMEAD
jgi:hypothetical protein